jgi:hypothetical protein
VNKDPLTTPILLLVFNRPETTKRVFAEVREVRPTRLYIAADGPRQNVAGEKERCEAARAAATLVDWPCGVQTLFRDKNLGCRVAVNSGLDWFFSKEEEGIILEDDCLPDRSFFGFADELLARYRTDDRVAMISGTNYLLDKLRIDTSYCFSRYFSVWGWASWRRVWETHDKSMKHWQALRSTNWLGGLYRQGFMQRHMRKLFDLASSGAINTWDIQFAFSCLLGGRVAVVPRVNLISNIGFTGTHTLGDGRNNDLPRFSLNDRPMNHPSAVLPDPRYDDAFFRQEFGLHPIRWVAANFTRGVRRLHKVLTGPGG